MENENLDLFDRAFAERSNKLAHEGVIRRSGRYPWGSGENPYQRNKGFLQYVLDLEKSGMSQAEIAKLIFPDNPRASSSDIRALKAIAKSQNREADIAQAVKLKDKGLSNVAIGERMGIPESSVRSLLNPTLRERNDVILSTANELKRMMGDGYLDIGKGSENYLGVAESKKKVAIAALEQEGYKVFYVPVQQLGTGKTTNTMVLAPPGTTFPEVSNNRDRIKSVTGYSEDGGRNWKAVKPPVHLDPKRISVKYAEDGGDTMDGVIQLRRGVDDLSLGGANYAQVRIGAGGTHYLKGMAMYGDDKDFPPGVDIIFNTNKPKGTPVFGPKDNSVLKPIKKNKETGENDDVLPFGSIVRQHTYVDSKTGRKKQSPLNIVGDDKEGAISGQEGGWNEWARTLSSQMLSKQSPVLARQQLAITYDAKKAEFDEIMALSNPAVKKQLLKEFADGADSSAKHLKAAGLPRTRNQVILPINSLKDNEIYAPNYRDGETVVLIRHPHGGIFEIPELKVNNRNTEANRLIKNAADAVGINSRVAARLSGADFDGDTVLVIPNNAKQVRTKPSLAGLKNFDPQEYKMDRPNGLTPKGKQKQMGDISNLITDMTIKGATDNEIARAVRHSMVVIDAEKHNLNYKQSALNNGIAELKAKYQAKPDGGKPGGASTLISRAKSTQYVDQRKDATTLTNRNVDPVTGKRIYTPTGAEYTVRKVNKRTGVETITTVRRQDKSTKMDETDDARTLISDKNTPIENVYADHANKLKALANQARKEYISTPPRPYSESARKVYNKEVESLNSKLRVAQMNAPRERQAQLLANTMIAARKASNPDLDKDDLKKEKALALDEARRRVGAKKEVIKFTQSEWDAVQAGAITNNKLTSILANADMDQVRQLATPRDRPVMNDAKIRRAQQMLANGYPQSEIADMLGVSASTLNDALSS